MIKYQTPTVSYNLTKQSSDGTTQSTLANKSLMASTYSPIDSLVKESKHWFDNAYRASNDQLYDLLAKCYGYYFEMGKSDDLAKSLRKDLQSHIEAKGYRFTSNTHTLNKIVKCVFGFDRRRVSAYGTVLKIALQSKVPVDRLGDFIRQQGGIEEVRLTQSPNSLSTKNKAEIVAATVESSTLGILDHQEIRQHLDIGRVGKQTLLVGTWQSDGTILIRTVIDNDSLVSTVLASQYNKTRRSVEESTAQVAAKTNQSTREQAINQAAELARLAA